MCVWTTNPNHHIKVGVLETKAPNFMKHIVWQFRRPQNPKTKLLLRVNVRIGGQNLKHRNNAL